MTITESQLQKWLDFYRSCFEREEQLRAFVEACAKQEGPTPAKIIMHQVRRLVMLGDDMEQIRSHRDALSIFWYVVCAEAASKLQAGATNKEPSQHHVRRFFCELSSAADQTILVAAFLHPDTSQPMALTEAVDTLYAVRCSVAHEGNYWEFTMADGLDMINVSPPAIVSLTRPQLRGIIVRTGIRAAQTRLPS